YADCWTELKKLADESGACVWVDANLKIHFRNSRGTDKWTTIKLREGSHLVNVKVKETINGCLTHAVALGPGDNIASRAKISTSYNGDPGYMFAEVLTFDSIDPLNAENELLELTRQAMGERVYPRLTVDAEMVKTTNGAFWVGDTVDLVLTSYLDQS